jgi:oligoribonuclease (3'-5' exoribonuclease)
MDNFEFNLEDGELSMTFSETVDTFTFSATAITIQSEVGTGGSNVTLSGIKAGTSVVRNPVTVLTMLLTDSDMNDIKALSALAIDRNSTLLSTTSGVVSDMAALACVAVPTSAPLRTTAFTEDVTNPTLTGFDLDMDSLTVSLTFSETVDASTLSVTDITLRGGLGVDATNFTLTGGDVSNTDSTIVTVTMTADDANIVKSNTGLAAAGTPDSYVFLATDTIADMFNNAIVAVTSATQATTVNPDTTDPSATEFTLDLNAGVLTITFNETVNVASFVASNVTIQDASSATHSVTLTGGIATRESDLVTIRIVLSDDDLNALKANADLATSASDAVLVVAAGVVADMAENGAVSVTLDSPAFTFDTTSPTLVSFDMNMNTEVILLTFSEAMNVSSATATDFTLHSAASSASFNYTLTGGEMLETSNNIIFQLNLTLLI